MIYLDNAATTGKKPDSVIKAVEHALRSLSVNPGRGGYELSQQCAEMVYECRKKVCKLFNCEREDRVIFTKNCTESINIVLKGVLKPNDHVITSSMEHNAVARPLYKLAKNGVEVDYAEVIFNDMDATVRSFERLIKSNTKMIICTHASNVTGEVMPIEALGKLCREKNILFAVDAAQTAGIIPIDMKKLNIDYLCIASHKGLYAPMGTGILVARGEIIDTITEGGTGTDSLSTAQPRDLPEMLESGTINVPGIAGISAGIDFVTSKGIENIYNHELKLAAYLYNKLHNIGGLTVYSPYPKYMETVPTISFNINGMASSDVAQILSDMGIAVRAGLHCAPLAHNRIGTLDIGTVRVCFSVFSTMNEIDMFVNSIYKIKRANIDNRY